jgi:hypothetical protein
VCQPQEQFINYGCYINAPPPPPSPPPPPPPPQQQQQQQTFLTPSGLLGELAAQDNTNATKTCTQSISEKRSETARKARQRAMANSIGFVPTDPWV